VPTGLTSGLASNKLWDEKSKEPQQAVTPYTTDSVDDTKNPYSILINNNGIDTPPLGARKK